MLLKYCGLILICGVVPSIPMSAQDTVVVRRGDRVRVAATATPAAASDTGIVIRIDSDTIFFRPCLECKIGAVAKKSTASVDVHTTPGGYMVLGGALGLFGGAALGAFVIAPCPQHGSDELGLCRLGQAEVAIVGGIVGLVAGTIMGHWFYGRGRWVPARWP